MYNNIESLNILCFSCKKPNHMIETCNLLHYVPPKMGIIKRYIFSESQERNIVFKRSFLKFRARSNLARIQAEALPFTKSSIYHTEESRTVQDSDFSEEEYGSHSSLLEQPNKKQFNKKKLSLAQNSGTLKHFTFNLGKPEPLNDDYKINEESKESLHEEIDQLSPNSNARLEKFNKLRINTKVHSN